LSQMYDWAGLLGFSKLPDGPLLFDLTHSIELAKKTPAAVVGLTWQRRSAELKRWAKKLRREYRTGRHDTNLRRLIATPELGLHRETFQRLAPLVAAPTDALIAAIEAARRELERLPRISPQRSALESAGETAVWLFLIYAADGFLDEPRAWWRFVLAFLDTAGFRGTVRLYNHPESLRPRLDKLRIALSDHARVIKADRAFWASRSAS
jgi:hypothetical protein